MIKLIATDMDGTLLRDDKSFDEEIFYIIEELYKKGITFVVASGRQYPGLKKIFAPVLDKIIFVAENGTYVLKNDKEIFSSVMDKSVVKNIIQEIRKIPDVKPVVGCKEYTYTEDEYMYDFMSGDLFNYTMKLTKDISNIDEDVLKVAIMDKGDVYNNSFNIVYPKFKDNLDVAVSGHNFIDFTNKNVNKGNAIKILQNSLCIKPEECMAFGDNYNDLRMLEQVYYSFAVENANDGIKKKAKFIAPSNNENGVIKKIKEFCF